MNDVLVIVPDMALETVIRQIRIQSHSLGIRVFRPLIHREPNRDNGVLKNAHEVARARRGLREKRIRYVCVLLDHHGSHFHGNSDDCAKHLADNLCRVTYSIDDICAVCIEPEFESWFLHDTSELARALGVSQTDIVSHKVRAEQRFSGDLEKQAKFILSQVSAAKGQRLVLESVVQNVDLTRWLTNQSFFSLISAFRNWFPLSTGN